MFKEMSYISDNDNDISDNVKKGQMFYNLYL